MALTLPGKELSMTDYCAFSKDHKCIKFTDYEITRHELEEADELCHDNWREIQHLREYIDRLQVLLTEHGIDRIPKERTRELNAQRSFILYQRKETHRQH